MIQCDWVIPMFIAPMRLEPCSEPFSDDGWIFEPKLDGLRVIYSRKTEETRLWKSDRTECTRLFPELHSCPISKDVVLDGVLCCLDPETGCEGAKLVLDRFRLAKKGKIQKSRINAYAHHRPVHYVVWDILYYKGRDLRDLSLMKRRSIIKSLLQPSPYFSVISYEEGSGMHLWDKVVDEKRQGMVAKKMDSKYVSRPSHDWLEIANGSFSH